MSLSRAPRVCDFRHWNRALAHPAKRPRGAGLPAPCTRAPPALLRSWGRAGGGPGDQVPDQPWCSAAVAPGLSPGGSGGIFHCPVPWSFSTRPDRSQGVRAESLGRGAHTQTPLTRILQASVGVAGGRVVAFVCFHLNAKVCGGGLWVGTCILLEGKRKDRIQAQVSEASTKLEARGLSASCKWRCLRPPPGLPCLSRCSSPLPGTRLSPSALSR